MRHANPVRWAVGLGALLLVVSLTACGQEYLQSTINPVTDYGEATHRLYVQIFWWTMLILAVVWALLAFILVRFREKPGQSRPKPVHGHVGLEIAWTLVPALIVVVIVIPTIRTIFEIQRPPEGRRAGRGGYGQALLVELPLPGAGGHHRQRAASARGAPGEPPPGVG
jgi:heme/copper-type cytochrome/quinol oxidase subunit 2